MFTRLLTSRRLFLVEMLRLGEGGLGDRYGVIKDDIYVCKCSVIIGSVLVSLIFTFFMNFCE